MCTVTYLPLPEGFVLTHNRDESPHRSPQRIDRDRLHGEDLLFPRDTRAGGAWIAAGRSGRTACVLNGAFEKHAHRPPYRRSRGLVLLDFFGWKQPEEFFEKNDFDGIEPFTLIAFNGGKLFEFRWDGQRRHPLELPADQPQFWNSSTLYPAPMRARREAVFRRWLETAYRKPTLPRAVLRLHRLGSVGDPENDFVMNRGDKVRTVSITQVVATSALIRLSYRSLLENFHDRRSLRIRQDLAYF